MGPRAQLRQRTGRSSGTCQISTTGGANAWGRPRRARVFASCWYISADEYTQSWWTRPSPATTPKRWRRPPPTTRIPTVLTPNATHQSLPPRMRYWAEAHGLSRGLSTCFRYEDLPAKSSQIGTSWPTQLDKIKNLHHVLHSTVVNGHLSFVVQRLAGKPAGSLPRKGFNSQLCWCPAIVRPSGTLEVRPCTTAAEAAGDCEGTPVGPSCSRHVR